MPCPHNEISIVQRSQQQSAVAAAAYQSGEKLFCEYDQEVKHYPEKRGIVHNEILLPANAPPEYADRNTLWNAAEAVEKQWNSQLARRWVLTIPREIPPDQYAVLVREFCQQQFVSKGMIADFAIHDTHPPGHNPHAHVLLTMRAMDEHGKWLSKSRKVYDLDENGERIKLPSGRWKSHKEDTVDWNDQKYCEIWRHEWEVIQNRYLEANPCLVLYAVGVSIFSRSSCSAIWLGPRPFIQSVKIFLTTCAASSSMIHFVLSSGSLR